MPALARAPTPADPLRTDPRIRALGAALAIFVALTLVVAGHLPPFWGEVGLVEWVNGWPRPLGVVLEAVMVLGTLTGALVVLVVTAIATRLRRPLALVGLALAIVAGYVTDDVVKGVIERPRPSVVLATTLTVRDHPGGTSYPSGHTTLAFSVAVVMVLLVPPRWRVVPLALAVTVAISRMYVGVHWPTDLVGGAALGTAIALGASLLTSPRPAPSGARTGEYGPDHP